MNILYNILQNQLNNMTASNNAAIHNCSFSKNIKSLKAGEKTKIPNDCQLYLGKDYVLNMRNPHLQKLLDSRDEVIIGRNSGCDITAPDFYNGVALKHAALSKDDTGLFVRNLSSGKETQIIPKNQITPFVGGVKNIKLGQRNIEDCFLLSVIYALSQTTKGQKLLEDMVKVEDNGDYTVKFHNQKPITVKKDELDGEKSDKEDIKYCVNGDLGVRAIERAYAKLIKEDNASRNFTMLDKGGHTFKALSDLTGLKTQIYYAPMQMNSVFNVLSSEGINNYVVTCSTPDKGEYGGYRDKEKKFIKKHAYSIKSIDMKNKQVEIINPHNTKKSEIISFEDFQKVFDFIFLAKI